MIKLKYLSLKHNKYWVYRPKKAGELKQCVFEVDKNGFLMPPIRIGTIENSEDQIHRAYLAAKQSLIDETNYTKEQVIETGLKLKSSPDRFPRN